jgi:hypothetical protein
MNLIGALQQHFNYEPLQKIDPNTQDVTPVENVANEHRFSQAAIPVILTGLRRFSTTDAGAEEIITAENSTDWVSKIFPDCANEVIDKVAAYSASGVEEVHDKLNAIAAKAVGLVQQSVAPGNKLIEVKKMLEAQMSTVLTFLPASLQLGELLGDNTIDDATHKMEGPISSLMQAIGAGFTNADEDAKKIKV